MTLDSSSYAIWSKISHLVLMLKDQCKGVEKRELNRKFDNSSLKYFKFKKWYKICYVRM